MSNTDLDQSGQSYQQTRVYLGPSLGWTEIRVAPQTVITLGGATTLQPDAADILVDVASPVTVQLPDVAKWMRQPGAKPTPSFERAITIKDFGGNAATHNITVEPFPGQTIDGGSGIMLTENFQNLTLWPLNDFTGWYVREGAGGGTDGTDGSLIFVQASQPDPVQPPGSIWIDLDSTDIDLYNNPTGLAWVDTGTNLKGPPGGTPGGSNTQVQYNNLGSFAGAPKLVYDNALNVTKMTFDSGTGGGFFGSLQNGFCVTDDNYHRAYEFKNDLIAPNDTNVGFTTLTTVAITSQLRDGENFHGGGTNSKGTFTNLAIHQEAIGGGQRLLTQETLLAYGMGDAALESRRVNFACGNISGDEGVGFSVVNRCVQAELLVKINITGIPTQATINTTTTQVITGDKDPQTVNVASSAGVVAGQWIVVEQVPATNFINTDAVQVVAVPNGTSITGIFRCNHGLGVTITPAKVIEVAGANFMGEQRVVVNLTAAPYTTGTVSSISGAAFIGSGTGWSVGMVGGNAANVGVVSMTSDDYDGLPYSSPSDILKSWYQITSVPSATQIDIYTTSVAGDAAYRGNGVNPSGAYTIRPGMRILKIPNNNLLVCETSTHTWAVNDIIECAICPYPDMSCFQYHVGSWTPGGTYRVFHQGLNVGSRKIEVGYQLSFYGTPRCDGLHGSSNNCWGTGVQLRGCDVGLHVVGTTGTTPFAALLLPKGGDNLGGTDQGGAIVWSDTFTNAPARFPQIRPNEPNLGLDIIGTRDASVASGGTLAFIQRGEGINTAPFSVPTGADMLAFGGAFKVGVFNFNQLATAAADITGTMVVVNDSTTAVVGATITGGGANIVMAWCNGTVWKVLGA